MLFHHVTYLLYTCIRIHPVHTHQYVRVACVHVSTYLVRQHLMGTVWDARLKPRFYKTALGTWANRWLLTQVLHRKWLSPAPAQSFHSFKALPVNYTTFSLRCPGRAAIMTPQSPTGEPEAQQSEATCPRLHSERGKWAWSPVSLLRAQGFLS